jgi:hypothetical protein
MPDGHRLFTVSEQQQLVTTFQPQFLEYRVRNLAAILQSDFDVPELTGESRVIARVLGACIVEAPRIQARVRPLLEDREIEMREVRFTDCTCVVVEVLFAGCHEPKRQAIRVKEVTEGTNAILKARGENMELHRRAVGAILEKLRVRREPRNSMGRRILLTTKVKRTIHTLARDHKVESIEQRMPICALCKGIFGGIPNPLRQLRHDLPRFGRISASTECTS